VPTEREVARLQRKNLQRLVSYIPSLSASIFLCCSYRAPSTIKGLFNAEKLKKIMQQDSTKKKEK